MSVLATQWKIGLASAILMVAVSLALISLFTLDAFTGAVTFFALSCTPVQVVLAVHWAHDLPPALARQPHLVRGAVLLAVTVAVGAVAAVFFEATVGGGQGVHFPPLVMFSIAVIVTSFWLAIALGGWPFVLLKNKVAALASLLIACYAIAYLLFRLLFNFSFLRAAPVYVESLDPSGMFTAWNALTFLVTAITGVFVVRSFELWPFHRTSQPVRGLIWTTVCLGWGAALFSVGVVLFHIDVVTFLVRVPIPIIFGSLIVLNVLRGSLFSGMTQPRRGVLSLVTGAALGSVLMILFNAISPLIHGSLPPGPPTYQREIWLANATLGITFPLLILQAEFLGFWPFTAARSPVQNEHPQVQR